MTNRKLVLTAEDDANDAFFLRRAFEEALSSCQVIHVSDGQEVVDYFECNGENLKQRGRALPDLLLLDLHMPRMGGLEVLAWLGSRREFGHLPKVVLSSSDLEEDKAEAQSRGACDYYVKPADFPTLVSIVRELTAKWLSTQVKAVERIPAPTE